MAGNTISYSNAVQEIKDYLLVHDKVKDLLDDYLPAPTPGSNMEKMKQFFQSDKLSFIFKKDQVDQLFSTYTDANAIRIYFGLTSDSGTPEPTVIISACTITQDGSGNVTAAVNKSNTASGALAAKQYPRSLNPKSGYNQTNFDLIGDTL
ncbi:hypothetical protein I5907_06495 [Panacibacter sp. DH6]|uniref:Uncharacterized protein n=1 Tax=Panacibacter microcysteis TaxID=2793269 RepID=A0A931E5H2_9BACT|nr:hypothetical protein [Panacibacter microcysteis]MBG9375876.1 hypothetical protein [Panacibacter microcysteis]